MYPTHYHAPKSLSEAVELFGQCDDPAFLSGGHTLLPTMKSRLASPTDLIDVRKIAQLHGIDVDDEYVRIGAAETHAAVSRHAGLCKAIPRTWVAGWVNRRCASSPRGNDGWICRQQ